MTTDSLPIPSTPFDETAAAYDESFTTTTLGKWLRSTVWKRMDECFAGRRRILEIGCGTGEDAVYLARRGHNVCATDVSMPMLEVARDKAKRAGCEQRIEFRCISMDSLGDELADASFDATLSNFGAVNCASRLDSVTAGIAPLLAPGSPLLWVVMGRYVPWEWGWFLARCQLKKAFRRLRKGGTNWRGTKVYYPTPRELKQTLSPHFSSVRCNALGFSLPPSYASGWVDRSPRVFTMLTSIERIAQRFQLLAALSDHYIMEAQRLPADANA